MVNITIQTATTADLDAIIKIAVDVIPQEPHVMYQYPYTDHFPEDCYRCKTEEIKPFLANDNRLADILVMVAEIDDEKAQSGKTAIAYTFWDITAVGRNSTSVQDAHGTDKYSDSEAADETNTFDCKDRRDAEWDRIEFYDSIVNPLVWKYLEPTKHTSLPRSYIHLIRVATSPSWQRHGAGTLLCNWGIDVAQKHSLQIGLLASPMGQGLYTKLGFKVLQTALVRMPEEKEFVNVTVMKWYPRGEGLLAQASDSAKMIGQVLSGMLCGK